ncbi:hypothetical protein CsSME_00044843 [Camellia sinensis var. sinensis]
MSKSDSDSSSHGTEYKNFRQITRERLLYEMLRSTKTGDSKSTWKIVSVSIVLLHKVTDCFGVNLIVA